VTAPRTPSLDDLIAARAVAVIGASRDPGRIGGRPIDFLRRAGFEGRLYPVNAKYAEVQGLPCYPSVTALPEPIDLAVIAVPAKEVAAVLGACAARGAKGAIVYTSGFAETGQDGQALQEELTRAAREHGLRIIGPNCQGLAALHRRLNLSFSSALLDTGAPGSVGLVAQSGAVGGMLASLLQERGIGLSHWFSTGNEADVDLAECIEFLAGDAATRVVGAYVENVRDGRRLLRALAAARAAAKPVVLLRAGRSAQGARAAASHTGALAGRNAVTAALLRDAAAIEVTEIGDLLDHVYLLARVAPPSSPRVGIVSNSGGLGVIMADTCADLGLEVPPLPAAAQDRLRTVLPAFGATGNPVDTTAQLLADHSLIGRSLAAVLDVADVDAVVVALSMVNRLYPVARIVDEVVRVARAATKPVLAVWTAAAPEGAERLQSGGVPVFTDASGCLRALAAACRWASTPRPAAPPSDGPLEPDRARAARALIDAAGGGVLDEHASKSALRLYGVPAAEERLVTTAAEAVAAADALGYPVALKACASRIAHKSDHGLVRLGLGTAAAVAAVAGDLGERLRVSFPDVAARFLVQRMAPPGGIEMVLGSQRDPAFGPVVMVGLGGIFVEHLRDVAFAAAPLDREAARRLVQSLRAAPLLQGARGRPPLDDEALAEALVALARFAVDLQDRVREVDVNPIVVLPRGQGVLAVDALVVAD
jgi:acyl-CoA synthetase (NDP forming)